MDVLSMLRTDYSYIFLMLLLLVLLWKDRMVEQRVRKSFYLLIAASVAVFLLNYLGEAVWNSTLPVRACDCITLLEYALNAALLCGVLMISEREKPRRSLLLQSVPFFVLVCVLILSYPSGLVAYHRPENRVFVDGPLIFVTWGTLLVYLALILRSAIVSHADQEERFFLLLGEGFIALNILNERMFRSIPGMQHTVTALAILIYYLYFISHTEKMRRMEQEKALERARTQAMISQIQPHFIYNSLACIAELCHDGAPQGEEAVLTFSAYLRHCCQSLTDDGLVPFSEELRTIGYYLELERMQDPDKLTVVWDIREEHFSVPVLAVETLVENAVKHGIRKKRGGGTVTLRTERAEQGVVITLTDDGAGFDPAEQLPGEGHLGLKNAEMRLRTQCGAALQVESAPGQGTRIQIILPEEEKK